MGGGGMIRHLKGGMVHLRVRLGVVFRRPAVLVVLILVGLAGLYYWPGLSGPDGGGWDPRGILLDSEERAVNLFMALLWMLGWPVLPVLLVSGRSTGRPGRDNFGLKAHPELPVGPRVRALVEVALILAFALLVRAGSLLFVRPESWGTWLESVFGGTLLCLPVLLAWALPATGANLYWLRAAAAGALLFAAMKGGWLESIGGLAPTSLGLSAALILVSFREEFFARIDRLFGRGPGVLHRPALDPPARLRRDLVTQPFRRHGLLYAVGCAVVLAVFVADQFLNLKHMAYFLTMNASLAFLGSMLLLKPLGSDLLALGMGGKKGVRFGDFIKAWGVLPLRRVAILRTVYLHGLLGSLAIWLVIVALVVARALLRTGEISLKTGNGGSLAIFLFPSLGLVPCIAGLLVSAAAGKRWQSYMSGGALLGYFHLAPMSMAVSSSFFPKGSNGPEWVGLGVIITMTLVGGLPPLALLRDPDRSFGGNIA